ncbi:MAG: cupin domain-containing protein [Alphaproteobacteria bacterium]|nr:cupin domain-containing protein [Alphaproteobacteria bacterium]
MARTFRRVVTGHNADGKSIIWKDGPPPQSLEPLPQLFLHEIWETGALADNTGEDDPAIRENAIEPHDPAGTIFRYVEFPPDEVWKDADVGEAFDQMGSGGAHDDDADTPGMHETQTTDYAIVLEGEMWAVMEEGETLLKANDVLIQRGTNHAWSNRSGKPALMLFVLIGAKPRN